MTSNPMAWAVASGCCITLYRILHYMNGWTGFRWVIFVFPAHLLLALAIVITGCGWLAAMTLSSTWRERFRAAVYSPGVVLAIWVLPPLLLPTTPFLLGFRHGVSFQITPAQLRVVRSKAAALLIAERSRASDAEKTSWNYRVYLTGPGKNLWDPDKHSAMWNELVTIPGVVNLDPSVVITEDNGVITMMWGGALFGHWGFRIHPMTATRGPHDVEYWAAERDIAFFMESN